MLIVNLKNNTAGKALAKLLLTKRIGYTFIVDDIKPHMGTHRAPNAISKLLELGIIENKTTRKVNRKTYAVYVYKNEFTMQQSIPNSTIISPWLDTPYKDIFAMPYPVNMAHVTFLHCG